jgi:hypothetical protein
MTARNNVHCHKSVVYCRLIRNRSSPWEVSMCKNLVSCQIDSSCDCSARGLQCVTRNMMGECWVRSNNCHVVSIGHSPLPLLPASAVISILFNKIGKVQFLPKYTTPPLVHIFIFNTCSLCIPPWGLPPSPGEEVHVLQWPGELCWRERKLLTAPPMPDTSKDRGQTKCSPWSSRLGV